MSTRRTFISLLAAGGAWYYLSELDGNLGAIAPGDGDSDTNNMTIALDNLDQVEQESGLISVEPGSVSYVSLGDSGTEYDLLGGMFRRQPDENTNERITGIRVRDPDGQTHSVADSLNAVDAPLPFGISPVDRIGIVASSDNSIQWSWYYTLLYW